MAVTPVYNRRPLHARVIELRVRDQTSSKREKERLTGIDRARMASTAKVASCQSIPHADFFLRTARKMCN
jgi:hypothetical protein